jgi:site-specific DNA-methyltransferase (adenine-specific)
MRAAGSALPLGRVLVGDALARLAELPDESVDFIVTSPPYFAMRDYGEAAQLGAEGTVDDWANAVAAVCDELARVLTSTGSLWLNLGDGYSRAPREGASKKSLLLGPSRVALRLTRSGWLLRNQIVWAKTNPMPQSVGDRLTNTHEFVYLFTRRPTYFFDLDAIREPADPTTATRGRDASSLPRYAVPSLGAGTTPRIDLNRGLAELRAAGINSHPLGKNPGDVWRIASASFRGAHFATFPLELLRRPILSTCPAKVCTACGQPWRRATRVIDGRRLATDPLRAVCDCQAPPRRGIVLDPFLGSGTTAIAAETYERDWIGIELNPDYARMAEKRLAEWRARAGPEQEQTKQPSNERRSNYGDGTTAGR